jgi:hypothetical protein
VRVPWAIAACLLVVPLPLAAEEYDSSTHEIVGGALAVVGAWPEVVVVHLAGANCTGTLIANDIIATAAHCFLTPDMINEAILDELPRITRANSKEEVRKIYRDIFNDIPIEGRPADDEQFLVVQGSTTLSMPTASTNSARVLGYRVHPEYLEQYREFMERKLEYALNGQEPPREEFFAAFDMALAYLDQPIDAPVAVLPEGFALMEGSPLTMVGFGVSDETGQQYDGRLRELPMQVERVLCSAEDKCSPGNEFRVQSRTNAMPCMGDSGGPLFVANTQPRILAGVLSRIMTFGDALTPCKGNRPAIVGRTDIAAHWFADMVALGPPADDGGCGCKQTNAASGVFLLMAALFTFRRRRARSRHR